METHGERYPAETGDGGGSAPPHVKTAWIPFRLAIAKPYWNVWSAAQADVSAIVVRMVFESRGHECVDVGSYGWMGDAVSVTRVG